MLTIDIQRHFGFRCAKLMIKSYVVFEQPLCTTIVTTCLTLCSPNVECLLIYYFIEFSQYHMPTYILDGDSYDIKGSAGPILSIQIISSLDL